MSARFPAESEGSERTDISLATLRRRRLENRRPTIHMFGSLVRHREEALILWKQAQPSGRVDAAHQSGVKSVRNDSRLRKTERPVAR